MLIIILIITFLLFYFLDFSKIRREQTPLQNGFYLLSFAVCFCLLLAYVLNIPIPKVSTMIRSVLAK